MKRELSFVGRAMTLVLCLYVFDLFILMITAPGLPSNTGQFKTFSHRLDDIVDRQWSRRGAIPDAEDLANYQGLLDELGMFDYAPIAKEHERSLQLWNIALQRVQNTQNRFFVIHERLAPYTGSQFADWTGELFLGPIWVRAAKYYKQVERFRLATGEMLTLRPNVQYHLAMALILFGDSQAATNQLTTLLRENPDYALEIGIYSIGLRAHAESDPDFLVALAAAGGSADGFKNAIDESAELPRIYPSYGRRFHESR